MLGLAVPRRTIVSEAGVKPGGGALTRSDGGPNLVFSEFACSLTGARRRDWSGIEFTSTGAEYNSIGRSMAKHCETFDHTADIGLAATGDTLAELFEALAEGLADLICPVRQVAAADTRSVDVRAEDLEALAVDFLTQVLVTIQTDRFPVASVKVRRASEGGIEAELAGETLDPCRHEFYTEVKAVTYHQLSIARHGDCWQGRVILDV